MPGEFKPPQVQVYETAQGHYRVRAGRITLSITQALDLAFRLHAAAMKAAGLPRDKDPNQPEEDT